jgi:DNA-directed RNA polymerase specialized sigma24 family protein
VIIQQESNEVTTAVVNRQDDPESALGFETSTTSTQIQFHSLSELLGRMLQELPEVQKKVIHLATKGISRREIAVKGKISLGTGTTRHLLA